ncbi:hypothetical protein AB1286_21910 [Trinickia sp. NRRL B-1857]|uniref:carboxymuconolactone decarboxylase family protein n=1 Tax=Trinickia sp. NRRL B-1857 TaxID=3162879 RepID=UPI003D28F965
MAGHSTLAKMIKMGAGVIATLRAGTPPPDAKLEALHRFATFVVRERGFVPDAEVDAFLSAGYPRQNVLEVILGVATKVMRTTPTTSYIPTSTASRYRRLPSLAENKAVAHD